MQNIYEVQREGESLVARLLEEDPHKIELTYTRPNGDQQIAVYENGGEISTRATLGRKHLLSVNFLLGYLAAYDRLGPELRNKIPSDWHAVLGRWLAPKE